LVGIPNVVLGQIEGRSCDDAKELTPSTSCFGGASRAKWDPLGYGNPDAVNGSCWGSGGTDDVIWYKFTATETSHTINNVCVGNSSDTEIALFSGTCGSLSELFCADAGTCGNSDISATGLTVGETYYIAASPQDNLIPDFCVTASIDPPVPPNDDCANADQIVTGVVLQTGNIGATTDKDLCSGATENNLWYYWTAPGSFSGDIYIHLFDQDCEYTDGMQISVFEASNCGAIPDPAAFGDCIVTSNTVTDDDIYLTFTPTPGNTYYFDVDGYAGNDCLFNFLVSIDTCLTISSNVIQPACAGNDGSISVTASNSTGPYSFKWSTGNQTTGTESTLSSLVPGTYTVTVVDANSCEIIETYTVTGSATQMTLTINGISACGGCTGSADLTVSGGSSPFTYSWSNGATVEDLSGLCSGTYTVTVTDAGGCTATKSTDLNAAAALTLNINGVFPSCQCPCAGAVWAEASGGDITSDGAYNFVWNNGSSGFMMNGLCEGTYTVTVTDDKGCLTTGSVLIQ